MIYLYSGNDFGKTPDIAKKVSYLGSATTTQQEAKRIVEAIMIGRNSDISRYYFTNHPYIIRAFADFMLKDHMVEIECWYIHFDAIPCNIENLSMYELLQTTKRKP